MQIWRKKSPVYFSVKNNTFHTTALVLFCWKMARLSRTAEVLKKLCWTLVWIYGFRNKNRPDNHSWFTAHHALCHGTSWIDMGLSTSLSSHIQWVATNCHHSAEWVDIYFSIMHNKKVPAHITKSYFMIYITDFVKNSNLKRMQNTLVFYIFSYCVETWKLFMHLKTAVSIHMALPLATLLCTCITQTGYSIQ